MLRTVFIFGFCLLPFAFILDFYDPFAHEVTLAADADGCYLVAASFDSNSDEARSAHLDSLLADDLGCRVARDKAVADEVAAERAARAARRGVFHNAHAGREHSAVDGRAFVLNLARE